MGWSSKIAIANALQGDGYNISSLVVQDPQGQQTVGMAPAAYLGIVAATSMKQRTRKQFEYYHRRPPELRGARHAETGSNTTSGSFVKNGDGAADVKPIAHLYKS